MNDTKDTAFKLQDFTELLPHAGPAQGSSTPGLKSVLQDLGPLPRAALFLGVADDQLPVLLNLADPVPGPVLVAGIGGVAVEIYKDVAFRVTPVSYSDVTEMLDELRGRALLDGFRGSPPADRAALIDVLRKVAALVEIVPELVELDLNPVVVHELEARDGASQRTLASEIGAVAVDGRMRFQAGATRPLPR